MKPRETSREIPEFLKKKGEPARLRKEPPTWRRQLNDGFQNPDGSFSWAKSLAIAGQCSCLFWFNYQFTELMYSWDALALILTAIIAPELIKKFFAMKLGGNPK